jgi:hypothetical protein
MTKSKSNINMQNLINFGLFFVLGFFICYMSCSLFGRDKIETMRSSNSVNNNKRCPPSEHYHPNHPKAKKNGCMKNSDMSY